MKHALVAVMLCVAGLAARAQNPDHPLLLVASPELQGPYAHTALVAVLTKDGQHIGFILNRATDVKLASLFPEDAPSAKVADPVYFGGPESLNAIFAMVRRDPGAPSLRLFGDVFVSAQASVVDRIIAETPNEARYFAGFVGWRPGELASEIKSGYWYVAEPDAALVFSKDTGGMWEALIKRLGKRTPSAQGMQAT